MTSPVPWADMRGRIEAAALVTPDRVEWPNELFVPPEPPALYLAVEAAGDVLAPLELRGGVWQESGRLYVHVVVPAWSGTTDARAMAKAVAGLFRDLPPSQVVYLAASIGAGQVADPDGKWWSLTVVVDWRYADTTN